MGLEYKIENVERKLLDKVVCDRCSIEIKKLDGAHWNQLGKPHSMFHEPFFEGFFLLQTSWGYGSNKDGETHQAVLCEDCYDAVFDDTKITVTSDSTGVLLDDIKENSDSTTDNPH